MPALADTAPAVNSAAVWWLAARPKTLPAAIGPVLIGSSLAYNAGGFHWLSALAALVGALLIQIGTNYANDYIDFTKGTDAGERLGPTRATQAGWATPRAMRTATGLAFGLACVVGVYLVWRGGWPIVLVGLASILFGLLYTAGPLPLSYTGLADLFVLLFFGPVAVGGTYFVQTLSLEPHVLVAGLAPGLFSTAILTVNNLRDINGDKRAGKKTLAVRLGARFARLEYLGCIIVACCTPFVLWTVFAFPTSILLASLAVIPAAFQMKTVFTREGRILNGVLAATGQLLFVYSAIFALIVVL